MDKEKAKEHIQESLGDGETLVGFFQAVRPPNFWLFLLIGPFFVLSMKMYFIAATSRGLHFLSLSSLGKFKDHDFFAFSDIEGVEIGKGFLQRPFRFSFKNNRTLKLKAQLKGVEKVAKLEPSVQKHIEENIPVYE